MMIHVIMFVSFVKTNLPPLFLSKVSWGFDQVNVVMYHHMSVTPFGVFIVFTEFD